MTVNKLDHITTQWPPGKLKMMNMTPDIMTIQVHNKTQQVKTEW